MKISIMQRLRVFTHDGLYLDRLRLIETPWFGVFLNKLAIPDPDSDLHDHPWPFLSIVLCGWYVEQVEPDWVDCPHDPQFVTIRAGKRRRIQWVNWKRSTDLHRIELLSIRGAWTLVFVGPKRRHWGFLTPGGWVDADHYLSTHRGRTGWTEVKS